MGAYAAHLALSDGRFVIGRGDVESALTVVTRSHAMPLGLLPDHRALRAGGPVPFLLLLAALKIVGALALWGAAQARAPVAYPHAFPPWYHLLFLAAFAGTGAALLWVARTDRRARAFGVVLVSFGTIFADPLLRHALLTADGLEAGIGQLLYATQVVAFTPAALWLVRQRLSRPRATTDRLARSHRPGQGGRRQSASPR